MGAELGVAAGPLGRVAAGAMEAGPGGIAPCYSYSHSKGLFIGISVEGSVVLARPDVNLEFYGKEVTAADLLSGRERPPVAAQPLYDALTMAVESPANGLNRGSLSTRAASYSSSSQHLSTPAPVSAPAASSVAL
ncbi:hypothetical protein SPRG_21204 [Saprolegnia parasitica CBS 223.65]|uniref:Ysc84 actin-binding domain-containing protein n=1 Tax=Saprolegnia parasitica (strain CBS 223.65) TaxID=695850 RepID=A0A067C577_SAPPC|nr:hypothetical protein SPRG_21204 [Saprolegnia parasitica CBS 223.65]KDO21977.1 hypothetical protein SPRG_21204 [Saprolegnia parasitica CBS 223.65]|eukprot:XP_012207337.1 hypothetical protein SPRG_21204 [Saprolegnia parasitica CBS 223.65]